MIRRIPYSLPFPALLAGALAVSFPAILRADLRVEPSPASAGQPKNFDPSEVFFQGWLAARDAEKLEAEGNFIGSQEKFEFAKKLFDSIRTYYPDYKKDMIEGRCELNDSAIARVKPKADEIRVKEQRAIAELEGGKKTPGRIIDPGQGAQPLNPRLPVAPVRPTQNGNTLENQRLSQAENEVRRLQSALDRSKQDNSEASRNASRVEDLAAQRNLLESQLRQAQTDLAATRARLAASPVESELGNLNRKIDSLEKEREAMGMALTQSRREHTETLAKMATLEADLKISRQKATDLQRNLDVQTKTNGEVVSGMREQMKQLRETLKAKDTELTDAMNHIGSLQQELTESQASIRQLQDEREGLMRERDQMSELLKTDTTNRVPQLIEQNLTLHKQLVEAEAKVDRIKNENVANQNELAEALRDLVVAKNQIRNLQVDKREQDQRILDLEKRLRTEEQNLAANASNPAEAEMLRDMIKKQLRVQDRRRQARELLVDSMKQLGKQDDRLSQAIELLEGPEIVLSQEEQKLLAPRADGEIRSPFAQDPRHVAGARAQLDRDLDPFDRAAKKAFANGRLFSARELYQQCVEADPGDTASLCKLGVVMMRLDDTPSASDVFRRATELDTRNSYSHRMLGFAEMRLGNLTSAEQAARRAVEIAPEDALAHILLGNIYFRQNRDTEAESEFKAAISADPLLSEPYYNLAFLYSRDGRKDQARRYYSDALERGAVPDESLEKRFSR